MKKVLVVYFTQSGQLNEIIKQVTLPLKRMAEVCFCEIKMEKPFPFPWTKDAFLDAFPETFLQIPAEIKPIKNVILEQEFDLVILGYQTWYLSPSIPISSFLKSSYAEKLLKNKPVITVSGNRNMWVMAQEKMKFLLRNCGAELVGNIALVDKHHNLLSVITIMRWMLSGIKKKQGWLPIPGVAYKDIEQSVVFGEVIANSLYNNSLSSVQKRLVDCGAVLVKPFLVSIEQKGNRIFQFWANFIKKRKKNRKKWLKVFYVYLWCAIWIASPIAFVFFLISYPLKFRTIKKQKYYYESVEL